MARKQYRYQSAVYLNNTAVTILSHGHCLAAMEALTHSLLLLESLAQDECENESSTTSFQLDALAKSSVATAQRQLAILTTYSSNISAKPPISRRPLLQVLVYNGSLPSNLISFIDSGKNATLEQRWTGLAVLLETTMDDDDDDDRYSTEIAPAIVLSNFALSHWYASAVSLRSRPGHNQQTTAAALRLLDMAQSVLGLQKRTMQVNEGNMFLALVIAHNTFGIETMASRSNQSVDAPQRYPSPESYSTTVSLLQHELDLLCALSRQMTLFTSAVLQPVVAGAKDGCTSNECAICVLCANYRYLGVDMSAKESKALTAPHTLSGVLYFTHKYKRLDFSHRIRNDKVLS
jgi:hypothetical protein